MLVHWVIVQTSSGGLFFVCGRSACRKVTLTKYGKNRQMARRVGKKSLKVSSPPPPFPTEQANENERRKKKKKKERKSIKQPEVHKTERKKKKRDLLLFPFFLPRPFSF